VPGTGGNFQFLSDSFVLPQRRSAPRGCHRLADRSLARRKGKTPSTRSRARSRLALTATAALYGVYLLVSHGRLGQRHRGRQPGTHGVVANDSWKSEIDTALGFFLANQRLSRDFQSKLWLQPINAIRHRSRLGRLLPASLSLPAASDLTGEVEVFSWWTGGGEAAGLDAMIEVFAKSNTRISNSSTPP
jgi:hypothetical protein